MGGLHTCRNPFFDGKNKLIGAFIKRNSIFLLFLVIFRAPTPALAKTPALIAISTSVLGLLKRYIDKNLQKTTKLALKLCIKSLKYD